MTRRPTPGARVLRYRRISPPQSRAAPAAREGPRQTFPGTRRPGLHVGLDVSSPSVAALAVYDRLRTIDRTPIDRCRVEGRVGSTTSATISLPMPRSTPRTGFPDRLFDPSTGRWSTLTNDPIGSTRSLWMIGVGGDLFEPSGAASGSGQSEAPRRPLRSPDGRHWRLASHPAPVIPLTGPGSTLGASSC